MPAQSAEDLRPRTAALSVISSRTPRNMSAPSARFSYDGLDLTGVIRSRLVICLSENSKMFLTLLPCQTIIPTTPPIYTT